MKNITIILLITTIAIAFFSCKKQDHIYKDFLKDGEKLYVGKVDTTFVHSGFNRIKLTWVLKDPNITSMKILWDLGADSIVFPVNKGIGVETFDYLIENLDERLYSFVMYTFDKDNNKSVAYRVQGQSYGEEYTKGLLNRAISTAVFTGNNVEVKWYDGNDQMYQTEIQYTDLTGVKNSVILEAKRSFIVLLNVDKTKGMTYRTVYKPNNLAMDLFYTNYNTRAF